MLLGLHNEYTRQKSSISIVYRVWVLGRVNIGGHWRPYGIIYDDYEGKWYPGIDEVSWHLSYSLGKTPEKPQPGRMTRQGIEPGPAGWEATMLPLDHSGRHVSSWTNKYCYNSTAFW